MLKSIFTYSLTILLLFSITVPTIISLGDYDVCETSLLLDIEEDSDSKETSEEVKEIKILNFTIAYTGTYNSTINNKVKSNTIILYKTIHDSLDSPPPEFS